MVKVIDAIREAISAHRHFFALEFFVPVTEAGTQNLYHRMERMARFGPLFCGVAWGDKGTADASIAIAATGQSLLSTNMQVNITGYNSTPDELRQWLTALKSRGVVNLMVLRGNRVGSASDGQVHFPHAVDLVRFIRKEFGSYFGIAVAGFPEGHEDCADYKESLQHLKEKVDAGADLIITHMVFDATVFVKYCSECQAIGIRCPILPGIMPINSYAQFRNWSRGSPAGTKQIEDRLQSVRNDDGEVKRVGVEVTQQLLKALFRSGIRGVYFFTMNMESVIVQVLEGMDLVPAHRELPWKPSDEERRRKESSRPIHWAGRATSYLARTFGWDEYPNGRWTDTQSPAYGEDTHYHTRILLQNRAKHCPQFATISSVLDVCNIFLQFLDGNGVLPWADDLSGEAQMLMDSVLRPLNARGLFTINSQPAVNGVSSSNPIVGWGPKNGHVFQKEYLEFFCSPENSHVVYDVFDKYPSLTYMARNANGDLLRSNWTVGMEEGGVATVTWGVFPNREVLQPTVVSLESFQTWTPEAFQLWEAPFTQTGLEIPPTIEMIRKSWILINVVDNEFTTQVPLERAVAEVCSKIPALVPSAVTAPALAAGIAQVSPSSIPVHLAKKPAYKRSFSVEDMQEIYSAIKTGTT